MILLKAGVPVKTIKCRVIPIAVILSLCLCTGGAWANVVVDAYFETILNDYTAAVNAETTEESLEYLESLRAYYEEPGRAEDLEAYEGGNALLYYTYAKSVIAFESKDYAAAWEGFNSLQGVQPKSSLYDLPPLPDTTYYYQFSMAVLDLEYNDFTGAFEAIEAARTAPGASAKACKDALEQFAQALKAEAQACCSRGAHEQAQEYYKLYGEYVNRYEGKSLLAQCVQHSQTAVLSIHMNQAETGTVSLSWTGGKDTYSVSWSADLAGKKAPESMTVKGTEATLTGLFPGTDYRVVVSSVSNAAETAEIVVRTLSAEKYPAKKIRLLRTETAGITRNSMILNMMPPNEILENRYDSRYETLSCWRDDFSFTDIDLNSYALYGFASYENLTLTEFRASIYYMLRSPTAGVYTSETMEVDISAGTLPSGEPIPYRLPAINLDDLLQTIYDDHSSFPKDQYTWEIYLDGMLFCRGSFAIK